MTPSSRQFAPAPVAPSAVPALRVVTSAELFGSGREIRILHHGAHYTLRLTRMGKLILTK